MHKAELAGLDGSNLLGYLAALGTLRVLTLADRSADVRMEWVERATWTPVLWHSTAASDDEVLEALARSVCGVVVPGPAAKGRKARQKDLSLTLATAMQNANPAFRHDFINLPVEEFRSIIIDACKDDESRVAADFFTAIGSDCFATDEGTPETTELCAIGAGNNEGFLGYMRTIHANTTSEQLRRSLFETWDYSDPPPFMRWDPNEFRPHALRASDPAKDRERNNMRGANRLAIEALPLFPTAPASRALRTTACRERRGGAEIVWPIWTDRLELSTVASLVASDVTTARPGIAQAFRAVRFTKDKYKNFSPAKAMW